MPTYQYACTACDHRLEAVQSFSDAALTECPACGGTLRKVFSAVGVVFKGSGFYKNDSRETKKAGTKVEAGKGDGKGDGKTVAPAAASSTDSSGGSSSNGSSGSSSNGSNNGSSGDSGSAATPKAAPAKTPVTKTA